MAKNKKGGKNQIKSASSQPSDSKKEGKRYTVIKDVFLVFFGSLLILVGNLIYNRLSQPKIIIYYNWIVPIYIEEIEYQERYLSDKLNDKFALANPINMTNKEAFYRLKEMGVAILRRRATPSFQEPSRSGGTES